MRAMVDGADPGGGFERGGRTRGDGHPDDLVPRFLPADPGGAQHGRLARPGLADDHLEAVARGQEHLHSKALLEVEMGMRVERLGYHLGTHLSRAGTDAEPGGLGDAAFDAQHLHRRVPAVAGARGGESPWPGSDLLHISARAAEDADDARAGEQLVGEGDYLGGGGVEGLGHRPQGVAAAEGRGQQGERNRPGTRRRVEVVVQDSHPVLPGQDGEDRFGVDLGVTRARWRPTTPRTSSMLAALKPPSSSGTATAASSSSQPARKVSVGPGHLRLGTAGGERGHLGGAGGVEPSIGQRLFDLYPAFGERPQDFLGDPRHFAQPTAPHLPGEPERGELGP